MYWKPKYKKDYLLYCNYCQLPLNSDEVFKNNVYCHDCLVNMDSCNDQDKSREKSLFEMPLK